MINHNIHKHTTSTLILSLIILTFFSGAILASPKASADSSASVNVSVTVPSVCSLTASPESVSNTIYPGHDDTIGTTNIKAICNDPAGLAVYAVGYTDSTYGNTDLVSTVGGTTNVIHTNVTTSGTPQQSEWNMTINAVSGTYAPTIVSTFEDTANAIPATYTKVAYRNTMTDMGENANGANFTAAFDAYIAENQAAGTYNGKVKFLLVHPSTHDAPITPVAVAHQICYYGNGEDEGAMACQTTMDGGINPNYDPHTRTPDAPIAADVEAQLRAPNFSRAGYGFTGWNTKEDGTGTQYGPNEILTITQDMYDNGLMLFANWKAAETGVTMQTFDSTASPYSTAPNGTVIALRDERDNDVYAVAKLPYYGNSGDTDGKWWMIENLRIDYDATRGSANETLSRGYSGVFVGLANPESANFKVSSTTANTLYTTDTTSTELQIITGSDLGYRFPRYNNDNTSSRVANLTSTDANVYSYGNYYTWSAAIADTTRYYSGPITNTSICPAGWRLPTGGAKNNHTNSEWWKLTRAVVGFDPANYSSDNNPIYKDSNNFKGTDASNAMRAYPTNLVYSGYFSDSSAASRGTQGDYWSSALQNSYNTYNENINYSSVHPGGSSTAKGGGRTVRCIAQ